jgi:hypothetical protein
MEWRGIFPGNSSLGKGQLAVQAPQMAVGKRHAVPDDKPECDDTSTTKQSEDDIHALLATERDTCRTRKAWPRNNLVVDSSSISFFHSSSTCIFVQFIVRPACTSYRSHTAGS